MSYAGSIVAFPAAFRQQSLQYFTRQEMGLILDIYGRLVSSGHLKDYAISEASEYVTFSFFRRASERPAYRIVKDPNSRKKQGMFLIVGVEGQVLKRGNCLKNLLKFFEPKLIRLVKA